MKISVRYCAMLCVAVLANTEVYAAESVVEIGGGFGGNKALLNMPAGMPKVGLVLLSGGSGQIGIQADGKIERQGNWIVRTRAAYTGRGIASLLVDGSVDVNQAIAYMRNITPKVVVVAMSRGSLKVPAALNSSPNGVVFASSMLDDVDEMIGDPNRLPPTLVIHHRKDQCHVTLASFVNPFIQWAQGRARVVWIDGGTSEGDWCQSQAYHGFIGREGAVVGAISSFAAGVK